MITENTERESEEEEHEEQRRRTDLSSIMDYQAKEDEDEYCQICGDTASGWHCG